MVNFADRMSKVKASEIRELLALTAKPEIISFAGGLPAPELFPVEQMEAAIDAVMKENGRAALQYGTTEGRRASESRSPKGSLRKTVSIPI